MVQEEGAIWREALTRRRRCLGSDSSISPTVADKRSTSMPTPDSLQRVLVSAHGIAGQRLLLTELLPELRSLGCLGYE